jgi:hypothetical protein
MRALLRTEGTHTSFIIAGLDPAYAKVVRALEYDEIAAAGELVVGRERCPCCTWV